MRCRRVVPLLLACLATGCAFGPRVLEKTHGRYAASVEKVGEEQLLRQIVQLRYNESAVGLDITTIAAQYELTAAAEGRPFYSTETSNGIFKSFSTVLPFVGTSAANRPTMTFVPLDDGSSVRRYMTPITLDTLIFLTQSSWPVSTVMRLWVERINGVPNAVTASGPPRDVSPDFERFRRVADLLQECQDKELAAVRTEERATEVGGPFPAEAVTSAAAVEAAKNGLEYRPNKDGKSWSLVRKERRLIVAVSPGAERQPELIELAGMMNLVPGQSKYDVVLAARGSPDPLRFPGEPGGEVRMVPRSASQVLYYLSNGVRVPQEHICLGVVAAPVESLTDGLLTIHSCKGHKPPASAFVAIPYRGYWFYIDDRDRDSKSTFALVQQLTRLDFARQTLGGGPTLTLPVGR